MKQNHDKPAADLRRKAEERLRERRRGQKSAATAATEVSGQDPVRLVHELQVHQIELEMQNEELQQARTRADAHLAQYTELYDFAPTGYLTLDCEGMILQANLTGSLLLGVERSRMLKRRFRVFVVESDRHVFSDFLKRVFAGETRESCEVKLQGEGTQSITVQIAGTRSVDGQECRAVMLDISKRKLAEAELLWENALLEAQLDATVDGILIVDKNGKKIIQNRRSIELWKIPTDLADNEDDALQLDFVKTNTRDPDKFVEKVSYLYSHPNETSRDEVEFKDGTILDRYSAPVLGKDGTYYGRIWVFRDITERKNSEEGLRARNDELERFNQASVGRELRMIELKKEINEMCAKLGEPPRYPSVAGK